MINEEKDAVEKKYWLSKDKDVLVKIIMMQKEVIGNYEDTMEKLQHIVN